MEDMLPQMSINWIALVVAALAYWILGVLWYLPALFGNSWLKAIGKTKEQAMEDHSPKNYVIALVSLFVASYGIARLMIWTGKSGWDGGLMVGLLCGICFTAMAFWVNNAFENRPCELTVINALYHLVGLVVAGVIIGAWG